MPAESVLGDPRFFERAGPFAISVLASLVQAEMLRPELCDGRMLSGVAPLQSADSGQVSVLHNPRYGDALAQTRAGVVIVKAAFGPRVPPTSAALIVADPHEAWARVALLFHPVPVPVAGVHASAVIDPSATVDASAEIGANAVVGARAEIGAGCQIGPGAVIGAGVMMGPGCRVGALASISHAILGARVYVSPGARIGQEGFGFAITRAGFLTVPQLGRVILQDDVEIGANSTVDRGASHDTVIGAGTRIDNLVQLGHNVQLGRNCLMAAQSGVSGSSVLGDFVQIGAQAGLTGHLTVGDKARVGAQAGVMSDVAAEAAIVGSPAMPIKEFFRNVAVLRRLARKGATDKAAD
jgi:UDP-3-O-[3-hydroxymyristoyl] glucosamine N-acyltransferase